MPRSPPFRFLSPSYMHTLSLADDFGGIGDMVAVNPLATGGAQMIPDESQYVQKELKNLNKQKELATVDVENFEYRETFGQVTRARNDCTVE